MGQPGGLGIRRMYPRLAARARAAAEQGFASVAIELPGAGERTALTDAEQARNDLRTALAAGSAPSADVIDRLILPLVDQAVPEWQRTLDAVLELPEIGDRVGFSGGVIAVGVRLAAIDPRITAAGLFAGSYVPRRTMVEARVAAPGAEPEHDVFELSARPSLRSVGCRCGGTGRGARTRCVRTQRPPLALLRGLPLWRHRARSPNTMCSNSAPALRFAPWAAAVAAPDAVAQHDALVVSARQSPGA